MHNLEEKFDIVGARNLFISEITLAELMHGVEKSVKKDKNRTALNNFITGVNIVPIVHALEVYAKEKVRLEATGLQIDNFDLLIGATAVANKMILVTNNSRHFETITHIELENWTTPL